MNCVAFKNKGDENSEKIKNSISLLMLIQTSRISANNYFASPFFRTKISSKSKIQLSGFIACCETGQQSTLVIQLPFEIKSDEHLLNWGDDYLGCFALDIAKSELTRRAQLFVDSISNKPLMSMWIQDFGLATSAIQNSDLSESEKDFQISQHRAFLDSKYKDIVEEIEKLPKLLKRNF